MFGRFLLLLSLIATVAACANADVDAPGNELPTAVARMTAPPTAAPTATFTPLPTNTNTPSPTPTHLPTNTPTVLPTDTLTATPTPVAKLDPEAARAYIAERLRYDAACPLPCWWGATPGETQWAEVYPLLVALDALIYEPGDPENGVYAIYLPHFPDGLTSDPLGLELFYYIEEGVIDSIDLGIRNTPAYRLHSILNDYGPPSGIRLQSQPFTPTGEVLFRIALLYEEQGFAAQITTNNAWVSEDRVVACLTDEARQGTSLFMWVPGAFSGFSRIAQAWGIGLEPSTYVSVKAATAMDVQMFFETYSGPDGERCINTPVEIWE